MKTIITLLMTLISFNSFAQFESFKQTFDKLILNDLGSDGFTLEYTKFNQDEDGYNETAPIISYILKEKFVDGLLEMNLKEAYNKEEALTLFGSETPYFGQDYYCYRLVANYDSGNNGDKECVNKLTAILEAAFADKDTDAVSILRLEGDYYGDWESVFLIMQNYDTNQSLIVEFDILHEI